MLIKSLFVASLAMLSTLSIAAGALENPQPSAIESGIGVVSGWNCQATAITIQIDDTPPVVAPYGSLRADTSTLCGGRITTGFSYLINYNTLATGAHTVKALADGVVFGTASFNVVTLGSEFITGRVGEYFLNNFPAYGTRTRVAWQQSKQNFVISASDMNVAPIDGVYFGAITTVNTGCTEAGRNGAFFEVDRFTVTFGAQGALNIVAANQSATCTFTGTAFYSTNGGDIIVPAGTFSCKDAAQTGISQGTWASDSIQFDPIGLLANITTKYTAGETCSTVTHIGAAR